jgi:hypothetical protein
MDNPQFVAQELLQLSLQRLADELLISSIQRMHNTLREFDQENSTPESRRELAQMIRRNVETMEWELEAIQQQQPSENSLPLCRMNVSQMTYMSVLNCSHTSRYPSVDPSRLEVMNNMCVICSQEFAETQGLFNPEYVSVMNPCQHVFHFDCILNWFTHRQTQVCPMCRAPCMPI